MECECNGWVWLVGMVGVINVSLVGAVKCVYYENSF